MYISEEGLEVHICGNVDASTSVVAKIVFLGRIPMDFSFHKKSLVPFIQLGLLVV